MTLDHKLNISPHSGQHDQVFKKRPESINLRDPYHCCNVPCSQGGSVCNVPRMMRKHDLRSGVISSKEKTEEDYASSLQKGMEHFILHICIREDLR